MFNFLVCHWQQLFTSKIPFIALLLNSKWRHLVAVEGTTANLQNIFWQLHHLTFFLWINH